MEKARNIGDIYECPVCEIKILWYGESETLTCPQCACEWEREDS